MKQEILAGLVLAKYLVSGIGSVAYHRMAPWMADQQAKAQRNTARGDADALMIRAKGQAGALRLIAAAQEEVKKKLAAPDVLTRGEMEISKAEIEQRISFQEEKRHRNIAAVAEQALVALEDTLVPDHEPDPDWTARFFNEVQDVSSEEMQTLWAKILAGEVERPGSTSIRTLGVLKNLDRSTAKTFRRFCSTAVSFRDIDNSLVDVRVASLHGRADTNALESYELGFGALNVLNEHGLVIADFHSWFECGAWAGVKYGEPLQLVRLPFLFQNKFWVLEPKSGGYKETKFQLYGVALTQAGKELSQVVDLEPMSEYDRELRTFLDKRGFRMVEVDSGQLQILSP